MTLKPFTEQPGPKEALPSSPLGVFQLFFTTSLLELIVKQTNQYALECMENERFEVWTKITVEELCAYLGFMILMGLVDLPALYDYWQKDEIFNYIPISRRISRKRFTDIHRYLHFVDNSILPLPTDPNYDKLGKIRPILNSIADMFRRIYCPHKNVSVDEAMIPFKGRSILKQYMPLKPIKRGIKVWSMADAENGFLCEFDVYTGKKAGNVQKGLGANIVTTLTEHISNTFRNVYFDNFFTSASLLIDLLKMGLYGCGTVRSQRKGFPDELKIVASKGFRERGDSKTMQYKRLTTTVWQDNKPVCIMATNSDPTVGENVKRKMRDGTSSQFPCPSSVVQYNKFMGGVDYNYQLRGYYHVRLKSKKFYKYIFWYILDVTITNSFILTNHYTDCKIQDMKTYRTQLAKALIGTYCSRKRIGRPQLTPSKKFSPAHFPIKQEHYRRCHYCYNHNNKRRYDTAWFCKDCQLYLCHTGKEDDCFLKYHRCCVPCE